MIQRLEYWQRAERNGDLKKACDDEEGVAEDVDNSSEDVNLEDLDEEDLASVGASDDPMSESDAVDAADAQDLVASNQGALSSVEWDDYEQYFANTFRQRTLDMSESGVSFAAATTIAHFLSDPLLPPLSKDALADACEVHNSQSSLSPALPRKRTTRPTAGAGVESPPGAPRQPHPQDQLLAAPLDASSSTTLSTKISAARVFSLGHPSTLIRPPPFTPISPGPIQPRQRHSLQVPLIRLCSHVHMLVWLLQEAILACTASHASIPSNVTLLDSTFPDNLATFECLQPEDLSRCADATLRLIQMAKRLLESTATENSLLSNIVDEEEKTVAHSLPLSSVSFTNPATWTALARGVFARDAYIPPLILQFLADSAYVLQRYLEDPSGARLVDDERKGAPTSPTLGKLMAVHRQQETDVVTRWQIRNDPVLEGMLRAIDKIFTKSSSTLHADVAFSFLMPRLSRVFRRLNLSCNTKLGDEGARTIFAFLARNRSIISLDLSGCGISDVLAMQILGEAAPLSNLRDLSLSHKAGRPRTHLGEQGAKALAKALKDPRTRLRRLALAGVGALGIERLLECRCLAYAHSLEALDLSTNGVTNRMLGKLCWSLIEASKRAASLQRSEAEGSSRTRRTLGLRSLCLSHNELNDDIAEDLLELEGCSQLAVTSQDGEGSVASQGQSVTSTTNRSVSSSSATDSGHVTSSPLYALTQLLVSVPSLRRLDLAHNAFSPTIANLISIALTTGHVDAADLVRAMSNRAGNKTISSTETSSVKGGKQSDQLGRAASQSVPGDTASSSTNSNLYELRTSAARSVFAAASSMRRRQQAQLVDDVIRSAASARTLAAAASAGDVSAAALEVLSPTHQPSTKSKPSVMSSPRHNMGSDFSTVRPTSSSGNRLDRPTAARVAATALGESVAAAAATASAAATSLMRQAHEIVRSELTASRRWQAKQEQIGEIARSKALARRRALKKAAEKAEQEHKQDPNVANAAEPSDPSSEQDEAAATEKVEGSNSAESRLRALAAAKRPWRLTKAKLVKGRNAAKMPFAPAPASNRFMGVIYSDYFKLGPRGRYADWGRKYAHASRDDKRTLQMLWWKLHESDRVDALAIAALSALDAQIQQPPDDTTAANESPKPSPLSHDFGANPPSETISSTGADQHKLSPQKSPNTPTPTSSLSPSSVSKRVELARRRALLKSWRHAQLLAERARERDPDTLRHSWTYRGSHSISGTTWPMADIDLGRGRWGDELALNVKGGWRVRLALGNCSKTAHTAFPASITNSPLHSVRGFTARRPQSSANKTKTTRKAYAFSGVSGGRPLSAQTVRARHAKILLTKQKKLLATLSADKLNTKGSLHLDLDATLSSTEFDEDVEYEGELSGEHGMSTPTQGPMSLHAGQGGSTSNRPTPHVQGGRRDQLAHPSVPQPCDPSSKKSPEDSDDQMTGPQNATEVLLSSANTGGFLGLPPPNCFLLQAFRRNNEFRSDENDRMNQPNPEDEKSIARKDGVLNRKDTSPSAKPLTQDADRQALIAARAHATGSFSVVPDESNGFTMGILSLERLSHRPAIHTLIFDGTVSLGNGGLAALAAALKDSASPITRLSLRRCGIFDVAPLVEALAQTQSLERLDLSDNSITTEGATGLFWALLTNRSLNHIDLSSNGITNSAAPMIAAAITLNRNLESIELQDNRLTSISAALFIRAIQLGRNWLNPQLLSQEPGPVTDRMSLPDATLHNRGLQTPGGIELPPLLASQLSTVATVLRRHSLSLEQDLKRSREDGGAEDVHTESDNSSSKDGDTTLISEALERITLWSNQATQARSSIGSGPAGSASISPQRSQPRVLALRTLNLHFNRIDGSLLARLDRELAEVRLAQKRVRSAARAETLSNLSKMRDMARDAIAEVYSARKRCIAANQRAIELEKESRALAIKAERESSALYQTLREAKMRTERLSGAGLQEEKAQLARMRTELDERFERERQQLELELEKARLEKAKLELALLVTRELTMQARTAQYEDHLREEAMRHVLLHETSELEVARRVFLRDSVKLRTLTGRILSWYIIRLARFSALFRRVQQQQQQQGQQLPEQNLVASPRASPSMPGSPNTHRRNTSNASDLSAGSTPSSLGALPLSTPEGNVQHFAPLSPRNISQSHSRSLSRLSLSFSGGRASASLGGVGNAASMFLVPRVADHNQAPSYSQINVLDLDAASAWMAQSSHPSAAPATPFSSLALTDTLLPSQPEDPSLSLEGVLDASHKKLPGGEPSREFSTYLDLVCKWLHPRLGLNHVLELSKQQSSYVMSSRNVSVALARLLPTMRHLVETPASILRTRTTVEHFPSHNLSAETSTEHQAHVRVASRSSGLVSESGEIVVQVDGQQPLDHAGVTEMDQAADDTSSRMQGGPNGPLARGSLRARSNVYHQRHHSFQLTHHGSASSLRTFGGSGSPFGAPSGVSPSPSPAPSRQMLAWGQVAESLLSHALLPEESIATEVLDSGRPSPRALSLLPVAWTSIPFSASPLRSNHLGASYAIPTDHGVIVPIQPNESITSLATALAEPLPAHALMGSSMAHVPFPMSMILTSLRVEPASQRLNGVAVEIPDSCVRRLDRGRKFISTVPPYVRHALQSMSSDPSLAAKRAYTYFSNLAKSLPSGMLPHHLVSILSVAYPQPILEKAGDSSSGLAHPILNHGGASGIPSEQCIEQFLRSVDVSALTLGTGWVSGIELIATVPRTIYSKLLTSRQQHISRRLDTLVTQAKGSIGGIPNELATEINTMRTKLALYSHLASTPGTGNPAVDLEATPPISLNDELWLPRSVTGADVHAVVLRNLESIVGPLGLEGGTGEAGGESTAEPHAQGADKLQRDPENKVRLFFVPCFGLDAGELPHPLIPGASIDVRSVISFLLTIALASAAFERTNADETMLSLSQPQQQRNPLPKGDYQTHDQECQSDVESVLRASQLLASALPPILLCTATAMPESPSSSKAQSGSSSHVEELSPSFNQDLPQASSSLLMLPFLGSPIAFRSRITTASLSAVDTYFSTCTLHPNPFSRAVLELSSQGRFSASLPELLKERLPADPAIFAEFGLSGEYYTSSSVQELGSPRSATNTKVHELLSTREEADMCERLVRERSAALMKVTAARTAHWERFEFIRTSLAEVRLRARKVFIEALRGAQLRAFESNAILYQLLTPARAQFLGQLHQFTISRIQGTRGSVLSPANSLQTEGARSDSRPNSGSQANRLGVLHTSNFWFVPTSMDRDYYAIAQVPDDAVENESVGDQEAQTSDVGMARSPPVSRSSSRASMSATPRHSFNASLENEPSPVVSVNAISPAVVASFTHPQHTFSDLVNRLLAESHATVSHGSKLAQPIPTAFVNQVDTILKEVLSLAYGDAAGPSYLTPATTHMTSSLMATALPQSDIPRDESPHHYASMTTIQDVDSPLSYTCFSLTARAASRLPKFSYELVPKLAALLEDDDGDGDPHRGTRDSGSDPQKHAARGVLVPTDFWSMCGKTSSLVTFFIRGVEKMFTSLPVWASQRKETHSDDQFAMVPQGAQMGFQGAPYHSASDSRLALFPVSHQANYVLWLSHYLDTSVDPAVVAIERSLRSSPEDLHPDAHEQDLCINILAHPWPSPFSISVRNGVAAIFVRHALTYQASARDSLDGVTQVKRELNQPTASISGAEDVRRSSGLFGQVSSVTATSATTPQPRGSGIRSPRQSIVNKVAPKPTAALGDVSTAQVPTPLLSPPSTTKFRATEKKSSPKSPEERQREFEAKHFEAQLELMRSPLGYGFDESKLQVLGLLAPAKRLSRSREREVRSELDVFSRLGRDNAQRQRRAALEHEQLSTIQSRWEGAYDSQSNARRTEEQSRFSETPRHVLSMSSSNSLSKVATRLTRVQNDHFDVTVLDHDDALLSETPRKKKRRKTKGKHPVAKEGSQKKTSQKTRRRRKLHDPFSGDAIRAAWSDARSQAMSDLLRKREAQARKEARARRKALKALTSKVRTRLEGSTASRLVQTASSYCARPTSRPTNFPSSGILSKPVAPQPRVVVHSGIAPPAVISPSTPRSKPATPSRVERTALPSTTKPLTSTKRPATISTAVHRGEIDASPKSKDRSPSSHSGQLQEDEAQVDSSDPKVVLERTLAAVEADAKSKSLALTHKLFTEEGESPLNPVLGLVMPTPRKPTEVMGPMPTTLALQTEDMNELTRQLDRVQSELLDRISKLREFLKTRGDSPLKQSLQSTQSNSRGLLSSGDIAMSTGRAPSATPSLPRLRTARRLEFEPRQSNGPVNIDIPNEQGAELAAPQTLARRRSSTYSQYHGYSRDDVFDARIAKMAAKEILQLQQQHLQQQQRASDGRQSPQQLRPRAATPQESTPHIKTLQPSLSQLMLQGTSHPLSRNESSGNLTLPPIRSQRP